MRFEAPLWLWGEDSSWHFVTLPEAVSDQVEDAVAGPRRGFGAVRVRVTVGTTTWSTSLFPSKQQRAYVLPVKAEVRRRERLDVGDTASFSLELL